MAYRPDRRATPVPRLNAVTRNEAAETSDLKLQRTFEAEREETAEALRAQRDGPRQRTFAETLKRRSSPSPKR
jgi:hypothetical protein